MVNVIHKRRSDGRDGLWKEAEFNTAWGDEIKAVRGWKREGRGVGLYVHPNGYWWLVHLNTGHGICKFDGQAHEVLPVATEMADATDWAAFVSLTGWQNTDPELPKKIGAIWARNPYVMPDDIPGENLRNERAARKLAILEGEREAQDILDSSKQ